MQEQDAFKEAVFFFDNDEISSEMHYSEFEALLNRAATVAAHAATVVKATYVVIGTGLAVRGAVCFLLKIDENGYADSEFSVPLRHLVRNAGPGPDVGCGTVRLAARSQCPVAWHSKNLWEPQAGAGEHPLLQIQRAVWRNRLGIRIPADVPRIDAPEPAGTKRAQGAAGRADPGAPRAPRASDIIPPDPEPAATIGAPVPAPEPAAPIGAPVSQRTTPANRDQLEQTLENTFGGDRRLTVEQLVLQHKRQIDALARKYRLEVEQQQQIYLDQIRGVRDEMQRIKSLLRHEQSRNQRLQQLLRGEVGS